MTFEALASNQNIAATEDDWSVALGSYLATLDNNRNDVEARKNAWRASMRLGLFEQAALLEAQLDGNELAAMEGDRIALGIRYGRIDARTLHGPNRFKRLDAAIAATDKLLIDFQSGFKVNAEEQRRLIDRISALIARNRLDDAIALNRALVNSKIEIPGWAQSEVAGAYLSKRQPKIAEKLYRQVLTIYPEDFDANLGLFYALVESEQLELAEENIDKFAASLPTRRHVDGKPNGEHWSAGISSDQARLYSNKIPEAQQRIVSRLAETPFNSEARNSETSLHLAHGWKRRGESDLRRNIGSDPNNAGLHADMAEVLLSLQRWQDAEAELNIAKEIDSENARVSEANQTFALHNQWELNVDSGYGRGVSNSQYGSSDWHVDTLLYSPPINNYWRAFAHNYTGTADFNVSNTNWIRTGVGAEWRSGDWMVSGEVSSGEGENVGVLTSARWQLDDHWKLFAKAESITNDIPLQAVRAGVTASRYSLGVDWEAHEARKIAVEANYVDFTDGNERQSIIASWFERWISGPRWTIETSIGADASHNSLGYQAAYFNPPNNHSGWLSGSAEHLTWRNYDYAFRQRLTLTTGSFWQSDYGYGSTASVKYQHNWDIGRAKSLHYSIGRSTHPYDGVREQRNFATMSLLWRF